MTRHLSLQSALTLLAFIFSQITFAAGDDRLGVQTHYAHPGWEPISTLDAIRDLGVGWIRDDLFWSSVEKERGKYVIPEQTWEWVKAAKEHDLKIILTITGGNPLYKDPYDKNGYVSFARFVAQEMRGHVQAIEIINEPFGRFRQAADKTLGIASSWNGWDRVHNRLQPWALKYLDTMNAVADAIHEVAPGEYKIIGLGCSPGLNKLMIKKGVSKHLDGITAHPYSKKLRPEWLPYGNTLFYKLRDGEVAGDSAGSFLSIKEDLLATAKLHGGPTELWLTEQGYTTFQCTGACKSSYASSTEEAQAIFAQRRLLENLGSGVRFSSWYNFYDKGKDPQNAEHNFGLMRRDGTLKPAYYAIQRMIKAVQGLQPQAWGESEPFPISNTDRQGIPLLTDNPLSPDSYRLYQFTDSRNGEQVLAIWSTADINRSQTPRKINLRITTNRTPITITRIDLMSGRESTVELTVKGNAAFLRDLELPTHPVLLRLITGNSM